MKTNADLHDDEYVNPVNGLIYCKRCKAPKQIAVMIYNHLQPIRVKCHCEAMGYQNEQERQRREEVRMESDRLRKIGVQDPLLNRYTFSKDRGFCDKLYLARQYAEQFNIDLHKNHGLLLWGDVGTGKSFFAGCIVNALLDRGLLAVMVNLPRLIRCMSGMNIAERSGLEEKLNHVPLLVLDDFGVERSTEYSMEQKFRIIDGRVRSGLPLIVTTNLTMDELKNETDTRRKRLYSRLLGACTPIKLDGRDIRSVLIQKNEQEKGQLTLFDTAMPEAYRE